MSDSSSAGPEPNQPKQPTPEARSQRNKEPMLTAGPNLGDKAGHAQLQLLATSKAGHQTIYEGDSPWQAMHQLSSWVDSRSERAKDLARVTLTDPGAKYGIVASRNDAGEMELRFESTDAQALYRQVVRERRLEIASPAENRISAVAPHRLDVAPHVERASRPGRSGRSEQSGEPRAEDLRSVILERLDGAAGHSAGRKAEPTVNAELGRQVLERASIEQLKRLQQASERAPDELTTAIGELQQQIERDVSREDKDTRDASAVTLRVWPPVNERFTVQEQLGRRDYWLRDRPDRLGFTESWLSLRTKEHSAAALMGMVDRAVELGWERLHLEGTASFKREAWIIATSRGITAYGYTATIGDREAAQTERSRLTAPMQERATERVTEPAARALVGDPRSDRSPRVDNEQLRQLVRKAIADGRVAPELEDKLTRLLSSEALQRTRQGRGPLVRTWDPAAARVSSNQRTAEGRSRKVVQRER